MLAGLALFNRAAENGELETVIDHHAQLGRFLGAGNAPFGEGGVDLAGVIQLLREMGFGGFVMSESESGDTNQQMRDYMLHALGLSI